MPDLPTTYTCSYTYDVPMSPDSSESVTRHVSVVTRADATSQGIECDSWLGNNYCKNDRGQSVFFGDNGSVKKHLESNPNMNMTCKVAPQTEVGMQPLGKGNLSFEQTPEGIQSIIQNMEQGRGGYFPSKREQFRQGVTIGDMHKYRKLSNTDAPYESLDADIEAGFSNLEAGTKFALDKNLVLDAKFYERDGSMKEFEIGDKKETIHTLKKSKKWSEIGNIRRDGNDTFEPAEGRQDFETRTNCKELCLKHDNCTHVFEKGYWGQGRCEFFNVGTKEDGTPREDVDLVPYAIQSKVGGKQSTGFGRTMHKAHEMRPDLIQDTPDVDPSDMTRDSIVYRPTNLFGMEAYKGRRHGGSWSSSGTTYQKANVPSCESTIPSPTRERCDGPDKLCSGHVHLKDKNQRNGNKRAWVKDVAASSLEECLSVANEYNLYEVLQPEDKVISVIHRNCKHHHAPNTCVLLRSRQDLSAEDLAGEYKPVTRPDKPENPVHSHACLDATKKVADGCV